MSKSLAEKTICHYILESATRPQYHTALMVPKKNSSWHNYSWQDYYEQIRRAALGLLNLGILPEDRIGIMSSTRHEWSVTDLAIMGVQAVTVPIYPKITDSDFSFIVQNSDIKILFVENKALLSQWYLIKKDCPNVKYVICFDKQHREPEADYRAFSDFIETAEIRSHENDKKFKELCQKSKLSQVATLVYTSGTTGAPKGAVITHEQIMSEVLETFKSLGVTEDDKTLSFLPYSHVLGRIEHWGHFVIGFTLAYAESIEKLRYNLPLVKPTIMVAVPGIFEKLHKFILSQSEATPLQKNVFQWCLSIGLEVSRMKELQQAIPLTLLAKHKVAQKLALSKVKAAFGGELRFAVSGGGPLAREIGQFFHASGLLILEGYGLTETTAAVFVNRPYDYEFGTVGKPIGDVQVKFGIDGEILIKSKKVMSCYFGNPTATEEVLHDGWFSTGDIGEFTASGRLRITDRKKDLIKTSNGKYVAPQKLEGLLKQFPCISNVLVHGDKKKYIVVLVTLDKAYVMNLFKEKGLEITDFGLMKEQPLVIEMVRKNIAQVNSGLATHETIKKFAILKDDFSVESGELTPSLKVKRKVLDVKYKDLLETLYLK